MRRAAMVLLIVFLLAGSGAILRQYESVEREDTQGKELLYLPSPEYLSLISLGNTGFTADIFYLWSIQYFSQFEDKERFIYLDKVFDLITDLDPQYVDPYRVGAIIMLIESFEDPLSCKDSVLALLEKGIKANPNDYRLANEAGWHCHNEFNDPDLALHYIGLARSKPNAPHFVKRLYGHLSGEQDLFTDEEALKYWQEVLTQATTEYELNASNNALYDLNAKMAMKELNPILASFKAQYGNCPDNWEAIIGKPFQHEGRTIALQSIPLDYLENRYGIDPAKCEIVPAKKLKED
jgi:tetratricopeptide (TPR) repeat protein